MYLKTSEILIDHKICDAITANWRGITNLDDLNVLDSEPYLELVIRVPYDVKGSINHMRIKSRLKIMRIGTQITLNFYAQIVKPIVIAIILAIIIAILYWVLKGNLLFSVLSGIVVSGIYFGMFYNLIKRKSAEYLAQLKREYL